MTSKAEYKARIRQLAKRCRQELETYSEHADEDFGICYPESKKLLDAIDKDPQ